MVKQCLEIVVKRIEMMMMKKEKIMKVKKMMMMNKMRNVSVYECHG